MKTMKKYCVAFTLILALSGLAHAGQIDAPPVTEPTPPPPSASATVEPSDESGSDFDTTLNIILTIISIF